MSNKSPSETTSSKKMAIDIGIPAMNEGANIDKLLISIGKQLQDSFVIANVFVISDGSTDDTLNKARATRLANLTIVDHSERKGKSFRMAELFQAAQSDILVLLDADVQLSSKNVLGALVEPIIKGRATLTSGRPVKTNTGTFTDRVMDVSQFLQDEIKSHLNNGDSLYACHGRIVAIHKCLFRQLQLPFTTVGNDAYLYLYNKRHGRGFEYVPEATVLFKMPQSLKDFIKQQRRFAMTQNEQNMMFDQEVTSEYKMPRKLKAVTLLKSTKYHIFLLAYFVFRFASRFSNSSSTQVWSTSGSTKRL